MTRRLNLQHAGTIAARELLDVRRDRGTLMTVAFFVLAMPVVLVLTSIRPAARSWRKPATRTRVKRSACCCRSS